MGLYQHVQALSVFKTPLGGVNMCRACLARRPRKPRRRRLQGLVCHGKAQHAGKADIAEVELFALQ
jgi:hypothetical protein